MKATIYYFTGTGNSLWVARKIGDRLGDTQLIPMAREWLKEKATPQTDTVGLVFPLYFQGCPDIVLKFAEKLVMDDVDYVFAICTRGVTGGIVFTQINRILKKHRKRLGFATYLTMPDNYIVNFNAPKKTKGERIYAKAEDRINRMADAINRKVDTNPRDPLTGKLIGGISYPGWIKDVHQKDSEFWVNDGCNSCGICVKVCPVNNLELANGKPTWRHRCQQCFACIHLCPQNAIQIGRKTLKRTRYRHPDIKIRDIVDQK